MKESLVEYSIFFEGGYLFSLLILVAYRRISKQP